MDANKVEWRDGMLVSPVFARLGLQCWNVPQSVVEVVMVYANYSIQRRYSGWKMLG